MIPVALMKWAVCALPCGMNISVQYWYSQCSLSPDHKTIFNNKHEVNPYASLVYHRPVQERVLVRQRLITLCPPHSDASHGYCRSRTHTQRKDRYVLDDAALLIDPRAKVVARHVCPAVVVVHPHGLTHTLQQLLLARLSMANKAAQEYI